MKFLSFRGRTLLDWSKDVILDDLSLDNDLQDRRIDDPQTQLTDGWYTCLWQNQDYWTFYCEQISLPSMESMGWDCAASASIADLLFANFLRDAEWRSTRRAHESFRDILRTGGTAILQLFLSVAGLQLDWLYIDTLHTLDLFLTIHTAVNIMWQTYIEKKSAVQRRPGKRGRLEKDLVKDAKEHKPERKLQGKLTKEWIKSMSDCPNFKNKGVQTRYLTPYAFGLARRFHPGTLHVPVTQLFCKMCSLMSTQSHFLTDAALEEFKKAGQRMLLLHVDLHTEAVGQLRSFWKLTPKAHLVDHLVTHQSAEWGNPAYWWSCGDEDLVVMVIDIAQACHPAAMAITALVKWFLLAFDTESRWLTCDFEMLCENMGSAHFVWRTQPCNHDQHRACEVTSFCVRYKTVVDDSLSQKTIVPCPMHECGAVIDIAQVCQPAATSMTALVRWFLFLSYGNWHASWSVFRENTHTIAISWEWIGDR